MFRLGGVALGGDASCAFSTSTALVVGVDPEYTERVLRPFSTSERMARALSLVVAAWALSCGGTSTDLSTSDPRDAGGEAGASDPTEPEPPGPEPDGYDYEMEDVTLDADLVVTAGETLRVGPGVTFTASSGVKVQVSGSLIVEGAAEAPVRWLGAGTPRSWHGIVVERGGRLELKHVEIGAATYGIHALPGSDFAVDHADIGTSFKAALIQSDGSFDHTRFHASANPLITDFSEVLVEDINGTLTIIDASASVSNSSFDNSIAIVDMVIIDGDSSPVFDHVHVKDAHCGFHMVGGTARITNSVFEQLVYGVMAYATAPVIENSVFRNNGNDVGTCLGATAEQAPALDNNYYSSGAALIDASCFQIQTEDEHPAAAPNPAAGPAGL